MLRTVAAHQNLLLIDQLFHVKQHLEDLALSAVLIAQIKQTGTI